MNKFYLKIAVVFSAVLILFGIAVGWIAMNASSNIAQEAIQETNRGLASMLVKEFQPIVKDRFDVEEIEKKLTELSGNNPQFDFYIIGHNGEIKSAIPSNRDRISLKQGVIDIKPLTNFISGHKLPILARDPLDPSLMKPFSAEYINIMGSEGCFLYVVLEGEQFSRAASMISNSYITRNMLLVIFIVLITTLMIGLFLFSNLTSRLNHMKSVVSRFERGQLNERIDVVGNDELSELSTCFNSMAETLVQNMEEIKNADKMRRELVANVSHDLRSPLASIQGYLETIEIKGEEIEREELKEYMRTVLGNTQKLNRMIDDLFELTKLDTDNIRPELELISMAELAQDLVLQLKPIAEKKSVNLTVDFEEIPNVLIEADMRMMNRALTNLIDNAIKHTPPGGTVTVASIKDGKDVVLEITDTGSGISEEDLPHIFDRFYQVDKSRSANSGAGLGLAIAQKILNLHGAEISVNSKIDRGTTFKVLFPSLSA